jgi:hypothetical protein
MRENGYGLRDGVNAASAGGGCRVGGLRGGSLVIREPGEIGTARTGCSTLNPPPCPRDPPRRTLSSSPYAPCSLPSTLPSSPLLLPDLFSFFIDFFGGALGSPRERHPLPPPEKADEFRIVVARLALEHGFDVSPPHHRGACDFWRGQQTRDRTDADECERGAHEVLTIPVSFASNIDILLTGPHGPQMLESEVWLIETARLPAA